MARRWLGNPRAFLFTPLVLLLLLVVACGAAATAVPAAKPTAVPAPAAAPIAPAVPNPISIQPAAPAVNPGKVTVMVGGWGGRFSPAHATNCHVYDVSMHGYLIRSRDDNRAFIPGIATKWEVSADGKTWTVTIRDGVKFHDGKPVTAADVLFTWLQSWGPGSLTLDRKSTRLNSSH